MTHPPIDFAKLKPIDMGCVGRALSYATKALDNKGQYRVFNPLDPLKAPHYVDLHSSDVPRCDCGDHEYRDRVCKHIIACLLHENHPVATKALSDYMQGLMR